MVAQRCNAAGIMALFIGTVAPRKPALEKPFFRSTTPLPAFQFSSHDTVLAGTVFVLVLTALLLVKAFITSSWSTTTWVASNMCV
jgi:hypothetical protein